VGIDCVAMCVNDVACSGAKPLFFLDYIACGKNFPEKIAQIVAGVAEGCVQSGCALVGGETAEHPGMMPEHEYDLAGFTVGIGEKDKLVSGEYLAEGNALIGVASSGIHSNGFSLIRKVFDINEQTIAVKYDELGTTLGEELITPTRIYVKPLLALMDGVRVNAISHITGGGFYENVPRMLNDGFTAVIEKDKCFKKPIFDLIQKTGNIPERDMYNTFNMGTGLVIAVDADKADEAVRILKDNGEDAAVIGEIKSGEKGVELV
ncbi:MAG: phosphoribosylformylglycinamidine cyclo-ligase, partial [Eubacterium sp.]|nr:phosphoribosylformylglycinamidine cyclo-ligase [Eubacterium sp.]